MSTQGNCKSEMDNLNNNNTSAFTLAVIAALQLASYNHRPWEAVSKDVKWLWLYFHLAALSDVGEICEVLRWLLRGHLRPGSRWSTQWQYHGHRQRWEPKTLNADKWSQVTEAAELSLWRFPQGTCFTSTLATSWATPSASWAGKGSAFRSSWHLTFCMSWEGSRAATVSSSSGLGWEPRAW